MTLTQPLQRGTSFPPRKGPGARPTASPQQLPCHFNAKTKAVEWKKQRVTSFWQPPKCKIVQALSSVSSEGLAGWVFYSAAQFFSKGQDSSPNAPTLEIHNSLSLSAQFWGCPKDMEQCDELNSWETQRALFTEVSYKAWSPSGWLKHSGVSSFLCLVRDRRGRWTDLVDSKALFFSVSPLLTRGSGSFFAVRDGPSALIDV